MQNLIKKNDVDYKLKFGECYIQPLWLYIRKNLEIF